MTDTCEHKTCLKMGVGPRFLLELCVSCGQIIVRVDQYKVKGQLYQTDDIRELLIDKVGQWAAESNRIHNKN